MRFNEIGQQLRAYRMESGLKAEEISARLGVSRAALYRYEKGEVIKLDTVQRLAELLKISPLALLGVGVEYYTRLTGDTLWSNFSAPDQSQSASVSGYSTGGGSVISTITSIGAKPTLVKRSRTSAKATYSSPSRNMTKTMRADRPRSAAKRVRAIRRTPVSQG